MITVSMCVRIGGVRAIDPDRMGVGTAQVGSRLRVGCPSYWGVGPAVEPNYTLVHANLETHQLY